MMSWRPLAWCIVVSMPVAAWAQAPSPAPASSPASASASASDLDPGLYQATAIVTGTDLRQRPLGFARCLTEVLVKVSGMPRLREAPGLAALTARADALANSYAYVDPQAWRLHHDDQGTYDRSYEMTVRFNPPKIDAALAELGGSVWRGPRPLLEPVVLVRPIGKTAYLLSAEAPLGVDLRAAIVRSANADGLGVRFPTEADLAAWSVVPFGFPAPLAPPDANAGRLRITGSLSWDVHAMGWVGLWHVRLGGVEHDWKESGVGFDQAFDDMVRGAVEIARFPSPGSGGPP